jgi:Domain of unknown function (DUF397)
MSSIPTEPEEINWLKSSFSFANGDCAEVAKLPDGDYGLRDSKDPNIYIKLTPGEWGAFVAGVKAGEFNDIA